MPLWKIHGNGHTVEPGAVVAPEERLNWPATVAIGAQHVVAMFGATFLVPTLTGFPVSSSMARKPTNSFPKLWPANAASRTRK